MLRGQAGGRGAAGRAPLTPLLPVGTVDSQQTTARVEATFSNVYSGAALSSLPWYLVGSFQDWQGNITAERCLTQGVTSLWQFPDLWHTFVVNVPPTYNTLQIVMVDTVTLTGDMLNDPFPAPPGGWAPPPPPLAPFTATDVSEVGDVDTGVDAHSGSPLSAQDGAAEGGFRRRRLRSARTGRRLRDFNTKHNPPVSIAQWEWLNHVLNTSTAEWIIVVGSDPVWSAGTHGPTWTLVDKLLPLLQDHGVALYLSGREPMLQHFSGGTRSPAVDFVGSGAGAYFNATAGALLPNAAVTPAGTLEFAYSNSTGFVTVSLSPGGGISDQKPGVMTVNYYDAAGGLLYQFSKNNLRSAPQFGKVAAEAADNQSLQGSGLGYIIYAFLGVVGVGCLYFIYLSYVEPTKVSGKIIKSLGGKKMSERTPLRVGGSANEWISSL